LSENQPAQKANRTPGARLQDTIRTGVARGDYPQAIGREAEWIAERLAKLYQPGERHEQILAEVAAS
jgi:hypothetical protein